MTPFRSIALAFVLAAGACAPAVPGADAGASDASDTPDAAEVESPDAAVDAGGSDSGEPDAGEVDAGEPDAGDEPDAGATPDAGPDLTPPETTLNAVPPNLSNVRNASFTFDSEPDATFTCALDDATPTPCVSPATFTDLTDGPHTFTVFATDSSGNADATPALHTWTIDATPPELTVTDGPRSLTNARSARIPFTTTEPATVRCATDDAPAAPCTSPFRLSALADGPHRVLLTPTDSAANTGLSVELAWTVDTVAPETNLLSGPPEFVGPAPVSLLLSSDDPIATFECLLDAGTFVPCTNDVQFGAGPGAHTLLVRALDAAGNADTTPLVVRWTVDAGVPDTFLVSGPGELVNDGAIEFRFSSDDGHASFECRISLVGAGLPDFTTCASPFTATVADGAHHFEVRARDAVGNVDATPIEAEFSVDSTSPVLTITTRPAALERLRTAAIAFTTNEPGTTVTCAIDDAPPLACVDRLVFTSLTDGPHDVVLVATDRAGNASPPIDIQWTVDATPPDTTVTTPPPVLTRAASLTIELEASEQAEFQCSVDSAAFTPCAATFQPTLTEGTHLLRARAIDPAGNVDPSPWEATITVDRTAPTTTFSKAPLAQTPDPDARFEFESSEPATFRCSLDAAASFACASPVLFRALANGAHTFDVTATDPAGNVQSTPSRHAWTIGDVVVPDTSLVLPSSPVRTLPALATFSSNQPGATFECRLGTAAFATCTSPYTFTGLADETTYTFTVRARLGPVVDDTPATGTFTVDVLPPDTRFNPAPSLVSGTRVNFSFESTEPNSTFTCQLDTGTESPCSSPYAALGLSVGTHTFAVRARAFGGSDPTPATHTFTVALPDTILDSAPEAISGTTATFTFSSDRAGATFECRLDTAAYATCTSPRSYTALAEGSHTFFVRAQQDGDRDASPASHLWSVSSGTRFRVAAANISSGSSQSYEAEGIRLFQGLRPDVVLMQEFNVGDNATATIRAFVDTTFGTNFQYFRETGPTNAIPNGVISRFPILASGEWEDGDLGITDRDFVWAKLDLPGTRDLVAVSVHLKASTGSTNSLRREAQANTLVGLLQGAGTPLDADDLLVIAGDLNTYSRTEPCISALSSVVVTTGPWPVDQASDGDTNAGRSDPYDWVLVSSRLAAFEVPVRIGATSFPTGLVFDSRVYVPISDVPPVLATDSGVVGMQHMPVVREFVVPP